MTETIQTWGPASLAQQGIWLQARRTDVRSVYHMPFALAFHGPLDRAALDAALRTVIARHPILGGAFTEVDGVPHIGPAAHSPEPEIVDLTGTTPEPLEAVPAERIRAGIVRPFDIGQGPLIRMTIFVLAPDRHVLLIVPHHLIFDAPSMEILKTDLAAEYRAATAGGETEPPAEYSIADYVAGERERIATGLPAARRYWREHWRAPKPVVLPGAREMEREADDADCVDFAVDSDHLREAAGRAGSSRFEFLLASLYALLRRYGNEEPSITFPLGLRTDDAARTVGFFAHEVPMTVPVDEDATFGEFVAGLRAGLRGLYPHRGVPVYRAVTGIAPGAFQAPIIFNYRAQQRTPDFPGLDVTAEWLHQHAARGVLQIVANDEGDRVRVFLRYPPRTIDREDVERIVGHWRRLIDGAAEAPETPIAALPVGAPGEDVRVVAAPSEAPAEAAPKAAETARGAADDEVVREVARIWQQVLRKGEVRADQSIFEFGVNSLVIAQIAARIKQRLKADVSPDTFYEAPTVSEIAAVVTEIRKR